MAQMPVPAHDTLANGRARRLIEGEIGRDRAIVLNRERRPLGSAEFPGVTRVPFILCPTLGSFGHLRANAPALTVGPARALLNPPGTVVNIQHGRIRRYLRLTCDEDYTLLGHSTRLLPPGAPAEVDSERVEALVLPGLSGPGRARQAELIAVAEAVAAGDGHAATAARRMAGLWRLLWLDCLDLLTASRPPTAPATRRFARLRAWVADHAHEPIGRESAARALGISPGHVSRLLRLHRGCGFSAYLRRERLERACALLAGGELPIAAVARSCGFDNADYFSTVFRAHYGVPPSRWRR